jgi:hypothetical protein
MRLHPLDLAIVAAYLLGVTALGVRFRRGQSGARDYFLGGRTAPWWALAGIFAIIAAILAVFRFTSVAFTWYVLFGAVTTFAVGAAVSRLESARAASPPHSGAA